MKQTTNTTSRINPDSKQLTAYSLQLFKEYRVEGVEFRAKRIDYRQKSSSPNHITANINLPFTLYTNTNTTNICSKIKDKLMISVQRTRINLTTNSNINTLTSIFHFGGIPPPVATDTG